MKICLGQFFLRPRYSLKTQYNQAKKVMRKKTEISKLDGFSTATSRVWSDKNVFV